MTPIELFTMYKDADDEKEGVKKVKDTIIADLAAKVSAETAPDGTLPSNQRIWQIVEDQKGKFLCFAQFVQQHYEEDLVPLEAYWMILQNQAPEIYQVWKWQEKK